MWYSIFKEEIFQRVWFTNIIQSSQISTVAEIHHHALQHTPHKHLNKKKLVDIKTA